MFLKPEDVLARVGCRSGMRVGDFGAGVGAYALPLLDRIGNEGVVYAVDTTVENLECIRRECIEKNKHNLFPLRADLNDRLPLKDDLLHLALVVNTLHAIKNKDAFLSEVHRVLRPGGKVLVLDWVSSFNNTGPCEEDVISPGDASRMIRAHGFGKEEVLPAGTHHFAFLAQKV